MHFAVVYSALSVVLSNRCGAADRIATEKNFEYSIPGSPVLSHIATVNNGSYLPVTDLP